MDLYQGFLNDPIQAARTESQFAKGLTSMRQEGQAFSRETFTMDPHGSRLPSRGYRYVEGD
jgi:hypothetical protein